jgi:ABC-type transport system involved in multi-copper enzyme maturation permease subunit
VIGSVLARITGFFDGFASQAVLMREAARTSRRWQTYAARTGFSGALFGVLLMGIYTAVNAPFVDISNISYAGRAIFIAFSAVLLLMAILLAPLMTSAAIIEETEDRTLEMLVLSKLAPSQILAGKVLSRILILITVVFGAMPVMAMVVTLGGVAPQQVVAVTVHTLIAVVLVGSLGAFFGLFTRSPMLAMLASAAYAVPIFWLLPVGYVICTGEPKDAAHFSLFAGPAVQDWTSPVAVLSYLPSLVVIFVIGTRLFDLRVSSADIRKAFAAKTWSTTTWVWGLAIAIVTGVTVLPLATLGCYSFRYAGQGAASSWLQTAALVGCVAVVWLWWTFTLTLCTWALLRVGVDVVDAMDAILGGRGKRKRDRRRFKVWSNPIMWREARPAAWGSNGVPVIATWLLIMLGMLQTGWWIIPGGSLAMGVMNTLAAMGLTLWLAARTVDEERRQKSLEVLLTTTMASPRIVLGKAAGVAVPTFPLMLLSAPFIAFGVPHLHVFDIVDSAGDRTSMDWFVRGTLTWLWTLPLWATLLFGSLLVALRVKRSRSGFSVAIGVLLVALGLPGVLGRLFEDIWIIATPCRMFVPPLAGEAAIWQYLFATVVWSGFAIALFAWTSLGLRRWISAALGLVLAVGLATSSIAQAQQPKIPIQDGFAIVAEPLADGIARPDQWAAVRVKIVNREDAAQGRLVLTERSGTESQTFERPVELPKATRKDVILLFRPNASSREREITLQTRSGRIARAVFQLDLAREEDTNVAVMGVDLMGIQAIRNASPRVPLQTPREAINERVRSGLIEPGVLPRHSAAYGAYDQVVWPRADPSQLDPAQLAAIRGYVADGGHLLLTVTENWRALDRSTLADMLPVAYTGTEDRTDLSGFIRSMGGRAIETPTPVARGDVQRLPGRWSFIRARTDDGEPLWVTTTYGLGTVSVLHLDPAVQPIKGNVDAERFWRTMLALPAPEAFALDERDLVVESAVYRHATGDLTRWDDPREPLANALSLRPPLATSVLGGNIRWQASDPYDYTAYNTYENELTGPRQWESEVRSWLSDIPGVAPLPMSWLFAFSALYLFVIGPLDWFLLRQLKRQPWTWVTFPLTIVVFSGAALAGTAWMKGSQAMVSTFEVVDVLPGTTLWRGDAYVGVFATRRTRVGLSTSVEDSVAQPLMESGYTLDPTLDAGFGPGRFEYGADTWTLGYASLSWTDEAPGTVEMEVLPSGGWALTNTLPFDLVDAELVLGKRSDAMVYAVGPLASGERKEVGVDAGFWMNASQSADDTSLAWMRQRAFDAPAFGRGYLRPNDGRLVLVAQAEDRITPLSVEGVRPIHRVQTLLRIPLTAGVSPDNADSVRVPGIDPDAIVPPPPEPVRPPDVVDTGLDDPHKPTP